MRSATILTTLVAMLTVAPATARADGTTDQDILWSFNRAVEYWAMVPQCPGGVDVTIDESLRYTGTATADTPGCHISLSPTFARLSRIEQCKNIVHEWGHLLGHGHDFEGDPDGIMVYRQSDYGQGWYINTAWTCYSSVETITPVVYPAPTPVPTPAAPVASSTPVPVPASPAKAGDANVTTTTSRARSAKAAAKAACLRRMRSQRRRVAAAVRRERARSRLRHHRVSRS